MNRWYACDITVGGRHHRQVFGEAYRRDPFYERNWITLVDGYIYQLA